MGSTNSSNVSANQARTIEVEPTDYMKMAKFYNYDSKNPIGRGAFGKVFKAESLVNNEL